LAPLRPVRLGPADVTVERRSDRAILMRSPHPLPPHPQNLTERLLHWAAAAPDRVFLAQREASGAWRTMSYAASLGAVRAIAAAFLERGLSAERPVAILSGNDIEHALIGLAAMHVGIPYAPISVPYSLLSQDFGKLKAIIRVLTPGLVFAGNGAAFARAIAAAVPPGVEVVVAANAPNDRPATPFAKLAATAPTPAVATAHAAVRPATVAKILFTSGSTGEPKGVINTQLMLCANQAMIRCGLAFVGDEPPVIVDWLPWNHTFGGNHNFNLVLDNGGSLYIDEGRPLPGVELKLVPRDGKFEARLKGANITPGYWRSPALTAAAFDEEGFYKIGDALKFEDPAEPAKGLLFDGRLAEDFKLATGTWVSVGPLRAAFIAHCAPLVRDVVLAGADRDAVTALVFPDLDACRKLAPDLAPDGPPASLLADPRVRAAFARHLAALAAPGRGTSSRVVRAILLADPPSLDIGEMTDKGSINQRAVLAHRASLLEALYAEPPPPQVIAATAMTATGTS
jgi:long-subunit acyl-CoA synthetase (AMP-forming)